MTPGPQALEAAQPAGLTGTTEPREIAAQPPDTGSKPLQVTPAAGKDWSKRGPPGGPKLAITWEEIERQLPQPLPSFDGPTLDPLEARGTSPDDVEFTSVVPALAAAPDKRASRLVQRPVVDPEALLRDTSVTPPQTTLGDSGPTRTSPAQGLQYTFRHLSEIPRDSIAPGRLQGSGTTGREKALTLAPNGVGAAQGAASLGMTNVRLPQLVKGDIEQIHGTLQVGSALSTEIARGLIAREAERERAGAEARKATEAESLATDLWQRVGEERRAAEQALMDGRPALEERHFRRATDLAGRAVEASLEAINARNDVERAKEAVEATQETEDRLVRLWAERGGDPMLGAALAADVSDAVLARPRAPAQKRRLRRQPTARPEAVRKDHEACCASCDVDGGCSSPENKTPLVAGGPSSARCPPDHFCCSEGIVSPVNSQEASKNDDTEVSTADNVPLFVVPYASVLQCGGALVLRPPRSYWDCRLDIATGVSQTILEPPQALPLTGMRPRRVTAAPRASARFSRALSVKTADDSIVSCSRVGTVFARFSMVPLCTHQGFETPDTEVDRVGFGPPTHTPKGGGASDYSPEPPLCKCVCDCYPVPPEFDEFKVRQPRQIPVPLVTHGGGPPPIPVWPPSRAPPQRSAAVFAPEEEEPGRPFPAPPGLGEGLPGQAQGLHAGVEAPPFVLEASVVNRNGIPGEGE